MSTPYPTVPPVAELLASSHWRTVDCISDLHLQTGDPATFAAWQSYMAHTTADAVCILGDLFEVWVGDDALDTQPAGFDANCIQVMRDAARQRSVFFMHGNRDFLLGQQALAACGVTLLDDPTALQLGEQRYLLSHGDALCLDDVDYVQFRALVRGPGWQQDFLAKPLQQRQDIARAIRKQSEDRKHSGADYADVDTAAACQWLQAARAQILVHGHTHRPALHEMEGGLQRWVLSDWDAAANPPRGDVLRISASGVRRISLLDAQKV